MTNEHEQTKKKEHVKVKEKDKKTRTKQFALAALGLSEQITALPAGQGQERSSLQTAAAFQRRDKS